VSDKCVTGHRLALPFFEVEPEPKFGSSRESCSQFCFSKVQNIKNAEPPNANFYPPPAHNFAIK
jgi:hypothetical protein